MLTHHSHPDFGADGTRVIWVEGVQKRGTGILSAPFENTSTTHCLLT